MTDNIVLFDERTPGWQQAFYAFLAEKERRSGSRRTVESYSRMLQHFFAAMGKAPSDRPGLWESKIRSVSES